MRTQEIGSFGLSSRRPPQPGLAVPAAEATVGLGTAGATGAVGVFAEDIENVRITVINNGPNPLTVCKVQTNQFSPDDTDARWEDLADLGAPVAVGNTAETVIQGQGRRWYRLRATDGIGGGTLDLNWSGA